MWILTEDYELVDLSKCTRIIIEPLKNEVFVFAVTSGNRDTGDKFLLMNCEKEATAWYLMDSICECLGSDVQVFSVTKWLDDRIEFQTNPKA
jgi:hypothetical protein